MYLLNPPDLPSGLMWRLESLALSIAKTGDRISLSLRSNEGISNSWKPKCWVEEDD